MENQIKFYSNADFQNDGLIKVDVVGKNLPENLFGVSFHLIIDGPEWQLRGHEPGKVFVDTDPLMMVQEKHAQTDEIVFGMTMKRGDEYAVNDGLLTTFFIVPKDEGLFEMSFENSFVVAFDNTRIDLNDVEWSGTEIELDINSTTEAVLDVADVDKKPVIDSNYGSSVMNDAKAGVLSGIKNEQYSIWDVYLVLIVSFFVLTFGYLVYLWFSGRRDNS